MRILETFIFKQTNDLCVLYYDLGRWCDGDLKWEKSENDFNIRKIIGKDFKRIKQYIDLRRIIQYVVKIEKQKYCLFFGWAWKQNMELFILIRKRKERES